MLPLSLGPGRNDPLHILCLGAHSDDIEIGCGGTILRLLETHPGSSVTWVVFAGRDLRADEARASAADFLTGAAGVDIDVLGYRESYFPAVYPQLKDAFESLKQKPVPDVIFTHRRHDVHQDHRTLAEMTWNAFRNHLILEYEIPKYEGDLGHPNVYVPFSAATAARKVELLMRHFGSQQSRYWFKPETFHALMTLRGVECHAPDMRAEAFHLRKAIL